MNNAQFCNLVEKGIEEFSMLIQLDKSEQAFQAFFEGNSALFQALGYSKAIPHPVIESETQGEFIPDFIVQRDDGFWQILELKRPDIKLLKDRARRNSWYAEAQSYLSQCIDYVEHLRDQSVRSKFEHRYEVTMHLGFPVTLIAGQSEHIDQLQATKMLDRFKVNISLVAFDQALASMQAWYSGKFPQPGYWTGSTIALIYQLDPFEKESGCIFDVGWNRDRNRVSLYRKSENIVTLNIIDSNSLSMSNDFISPDKAVGRSVPLMINIFPVDDILRVVLEANGLQVVDIRSSNMDMNLNMPVPVILGNDFEASGSAQFVNGMFLTRTPTFTMSERTKIREHMEEFCHNYRRNSGDTINGLRFGLDQFMYNIGHPHYDPVYKFSTHMVQRNDKFRPIACK